MLGWGKDAWKTVKQWLKTGIEPTHKLKGKPSNRNQSVRIETQDTLHTFFTELEQLGAPGATEVVRNFEGDVVTQQLKYSNEDMIELPSCYSKRSLYNRYSEECGWRNIYSNEMLLKGEIKALHCHGRHS